MSCRKLYLSIFVALHVLLVELPLILINKKLINKQVIVFVIKKVKPDTLKLRFVDVIGERYAEIEYRRGKVSQRWRGSDGDWNMRVTFAYLIY